MSKRNTANQKKKTTKSRQGTISFYEYRHSHVSIFSFNFKLHKLYIIVIMRYMHMQRVGEGRQMLGPLGAWERMHTTPNGQWTTPAAGEYHVSI